MSGLREQRTPVVELGQLGSLYVADTNAKTGSWGIIYSIDSSTVISTLTSAFREDGSTRLMLGTLTSIPLPAGCAIYGNFLGFTLSAGRVIAYEV